MLVGPDIAAVAPLIGDRTRIRMLAALMDGSARTATELSLVSDVSPSTASSHLAQLTRGGLLGLVRQGRHRYYRIASAEVAQALEGLMSLGQTDHVDGPSAPRDPALRYARMCYDHLAGEAGVRLLQRLRHARFIVGSVDRPRLATSGEAWCGALGMPIAELKRGRRPLCRSCLDWSERRDHLAGALGAALLDRMLALRLVARTRRLRALHVTPRGEAFIEGLQIPTNAGRRASGR